MSVAGAYWRGDRDSARCCREFTGRVSRRQAELDEYLQRLEEAKKRDHRKIGKEMDLFALY